MARSSLGMHWIRVHPDNYDLEHLQKMQYKSIKLFEWHWSDSNACRDLLAVLPGDAYILARDHPLSEEDIWGDPIATGIRHANTWADKVRNGQYHLPTDRTFFLGKNEPDATSGDRAKIDRYTAAFLDRLRQHGLRGGAFNFSTGHPRTKDGTPHSKPDYTVFEMGHQAIVRGHHIGVMHIYGTASTPCAPGHYDRIHSCPWQDVQWVIGECGIDEHVIGGGPHYGWLHSLGGNANAYCDWLDRLILGTNDSRIHSWQVFTYDFSQPWHSFDTRPARQAFQTYGWKHGGVTPTPPEPEQPLDTGVVTAPAGLNVRSGPGTQYSILYAIPYGTEVNVYEVTTQDGNQWYRIGTNEWVIATWVQLDGEQPPVEPPPPGDKWERCLNWVLKWEGGWADDPNDIGGATMKGITLGTYTRWCAEKGKPRPSKEDLRNISDVEVHQIYYEWYWVPSHSNELAWPLCLANFNIAVNAGVGQSDEFLKQSGNNFLLYQAHATAWYTTISGWPHYGKAWTRRNADVLREAAK